MKTRLVLLLCSFLVLSCGGTESANGTAGSCNPLAFAMLNTANSDAKVCSATVACIDAHCAEGAVECAGPEYRSLNYAGTCGSYLNCVKACDCEKACVDQCDPGTMECASCLSITFALGCTMKCVSEIASCGAK